jgi:hypothetical protein
VTGEAGDEHQRVAADRTADLRAPVLTRPQTRRIASHGIPAASMIFCSTSTSRSPPEHTR